MRKAIAALGLAGLGLLMCSVVEGAYPIREILDMNGFEVVRVGTPTASTSAATRSYVDSSAAVAAPPGAIVAFGGAAAPSGWTLCDGTAISRTTFAALFAAIGTTYGVGNGTTTFNVPDFRQRFPLGLAAAGTGNAMGATGGAIDHTHAVGSLAAATEAAHTHAFTPNGETAQTPITPVTVGADTAGVTGAGSAHTHTLSGSTAAENPPFLVVRYIVKN